jgi:hypothetical protein
MAGMTAKQFAQSVRLLLASLIDYWDRPRAKRWCWAELVCWAIDRKPWKSLRFCRSTSIYTICGYCGKHMSEEPEGARYNGKQDGPD